MNSSLPQDEDELLRQMDKDISVLVLVQGVLPDGSPHYAYASIPPSRYGAFKAAEAQGNYDLAAFGRILTHGEGKTPPPEVRKRMVEEYGVNHCFEEDLARYMDELNGLKPDTEDAAT